MTRAKPLWNNQIKASSQRFRRCKTKDPLRCGVPREDLPFRIGGDNGVAGGLNYQPAKASVFLIDRTCKFTRVYPDGKRESVTQSCNATDEFKAIVEKVLQTLGAIGQR